MAITLKITEKDYLHDAFMHIRRWRRVVYHIVLFSITNMAGLAALLIAGNTGISFTRIVGMVLLALTIFFILVLALSYVRLKSAYASNSILHEDINYIFSADGIHAITAVSQAYILPEKQMSATKITELFNMLGTHLSPSKVKVN